MNRYIKMAFDKLGEKTAERSGLPYMNHILEGLIILNHLQAEQFILDAWSIHPLFQNNFLLNGLVTTKELDTIDPKIVLLATEYRNLANNYRPKDFKIGELPKISNILQVNTMLIADKVQNRKDYELHQTHNEELTSYFEQWFQALKIEESWYMKICELITKEPR